MPWADRRQWRLQDGEGAEGIQGAHREAHHLVGEVVSLAEKSAKPLNQLTLKELQGVSQKFKAGALEVFELKKALGKRTATGSPGTKEVKKQLRRWVKRLG